MNKLLSVQDVQDRFVERYRHVESDLVRDIERCVCGCDYGASSWTTVDEIQLIIALLGLNEDKYMLELGAGTGWPGLKLAEQTACQALLTDLPLDGLKIAHRRAATDGLDEKVAVAAASGSLLPFPTASFDAVFHSDVLCCLPEKKEVLEECRRCVAPGGCMVFPVIFPTTNLSAEDQQLVLDGGPPFGEIEQSYPDMLAQTGWEMTKQIDLTDQFTQSMALMDKKLTQYSGELDNLKGQEIAAEERCRRANAVRATVRGILRRDLYRAIPA